MKVYLSHFSETMKPPTLWAMYSMIKSCLAAKENVNVDTAPKIDISINFNTHYLRNSKQNKHFLFISRTWYRKGNSEHFMKGTII